MAHTKKTNKAPASASMDPLAPSVHGSEEHYHHHLAAALALPADDIKPFRADASLAYHNALEGVKNVMSREAELAAQLPKEDVARLKHLPDVVLGLLFAVLQADGAPEQPRTLRQELNEALKLRRILLKGFDALTEAGEFTQREYDTIAAGRGVLDAVNDCIALAAKYRSKWSLIAKKTAVTPTQVAKAAELGSKLQGEFKSGRTRRTKAKTGAAAEAAEVRDRFWTLALQIHERLWRVGALLYGREVDDYVPALQATRRKSTAASRAASAQKVAKRAVEKAQKAADKAAQASAKKGAKKKTPV